MIDLKEIVVRPEFNSIINACYDGIWITDGEGKILTINAAYEKLSGIRASDVVGKKMQALQLEGFISDSAILRSLKKKEKVMIIQNNLLTGKKCIVCANPIFDSDGNIIIIVANTMDLTGLNRLQDQLQHSTERLFQIFESGLRDLLKDMNFIFQSRKMQGMVTMVYNVSQVDSTILILGESGVGKELIAQLIHGLGKRKNKAFVKLNCGAIPENLLESELFGYEKGAFTGANQRKKGLFELADGGDIFLDEIGDLPFNMQVKVLRVLQEGEFFKVGGGEPIRVDVRIIASTNRDLEKMMREGKFRKDLFYRLHVIPLTIPPLRERKEDINIFICHYMDYFNRKHGFNKDIELEAINLLTKYDWPGNVRELINLVERLIVTVPESTIRAEHLPDSIRIKAWNHEPLKMNSIMPLSEAVEELEKQLITMALEKYGSSYKAAKALKTSQSSVSRRLQKYNLKKLD